MDGYFFVPEDNLIGAPAGGEEDPRDAGGVHAGDESGRVGFQKVREAVEWDYWKGQGTSGMGFWGACSVEGSGGVLYRDRLCGNAIFDAAMHDLRRMKEAYRTDGSCPCVHDG
jgi:hypothetical protein